MNISKLEKFDDVKRDAAILKNDMVGLAGEIGARASEGLQEAGSLAKSELEKTKERAASELSSLADYISRKPLQSVATAFAIGAVLNFVMGRR